jgi:hypothetical protein
MAMTITNNSRRRILMDEFHELASSFAPHSSLPRLILSLLLSFSLLSRHCLTNKKKKKLRRRRRKANRHLVGKHEEE